MDLDNWANKLIETHSDPEKLVMRIVQKFEAEGIKFNENQLTQIQAQIPEQLLDIFSKESFNLKIDSDEDRVTSLNFDDQDFLIPTEKLIDIIDGAISVDIEERANSLLAEWKKQAKKQIEQHKKSQQTVNEDVKSTWGTALDTLEMLIAICLENDTGFNELFRSEVSTENDFVFEAIVSLRARGCQVAKEIHLLLSNGFANGAHARWRTLHEIVVTVLFIKKHGQEVAKRYLQHSGMEFIKEIKAHQRYGESLGRQLFTEEEMKQIEAHRKNLIQQFSTDTKKKNFSHDYGWASEIIKESRPEFYHIEKDVGLDNLRPFVQMAHRNIHAPSSSILSPPGSSSENTTVLLAGPNANDLYIPGKNAAQSILRLIFELCSLKGNIDSSVYVLAIQGLHQEIQDAFHNIETEMAQKTPQYGFLASDENN